MAIAEHSPDEGPLWLSSRVKITQEVDNPAKRYAGKKLPKGWKVVEIDRGKKSAMKKLERELELKKPVLKNNVSWAGTRKGSH